MKYDRKFKCFAVSENANSFGLYQAILVSYVGAVYSVCTNSRNIPKKGDDVWVPVLVDENGNFTGYDLSRFELPQRLPNATQDMINEIFAVPKSPV